MNMELASNENRIQNKEKGKKTIIVNKTVVALFYILPILDSLSGYLSRNTGRTIGPIYHFFFAMLLLFLALYLQNGRINAKRIRLLFFCFVSILLSIIMNFLFDRDYSLDSSRAIKSLVSYIYIYSFLTILQKDNSISITVFDYSSIVIPLILFSLRLTKLGYNYYSGGSSGYVGWYSSLDELNVILTILLLYSVISFSATDFLCYMRLVMIAICMILVSSKASLLLLASIAGYFIMYRLISIIKRKRIRIASIVFFLIGIWAVFQFVVPAINQNIDKFLSRQRYLYGLKGNSGLSFFSTGRFDRFEELIFQPLNQLESKKMVLSIVRAIFGNGFVHYSYFGATGDIQFEMDFFDAYFWMGISGMVCYIWLFVYLWKRVNRRQKSFHKYLGFFVPVIISFLIGHVLFAGVASIYFGLYLATLTTIDLSVVRERKSKFKRR